jgi:2'-5' RNA ligase
MLLFTVEFFFEDSFEKYVKSIWKGLSDNQITSNMYDIAEIRPHITVAVYNHIPNLEGYVVRLKSFFKDVSEFNVKFDALSTFPTSGTLFIDPTVTEGLIQLHKKYHNEFGDLAEQANNYLPEIWAPHCTLAIRLNTAQMLEAISYCYKEFSPFISKITEAGLVKLDFNSNNKCLSSRTVASIALKSN